jgi:hypothetical protein
VPKTILGGFLWVLLFPPPRYNWNIVESGDKHLKPTKPINNTSLILVFSDWLVNRRHCSQQWQKTAAQIREKINIAIQDMPPVDEITQLLQGSCKYQHSYQVQMHDFMLEAGLSIRDGIRYFYTPKMVFGTSWF